MLKKNRSDYTLDQVMIVASIIQSEAADTDDMYYISSIIYNRLNADEDMGVKYLGLDSTKFYPYRTQADIPEDARDIFEVHMTHILKKAYRQVKSVTRV